MRRGRTHFQGGVRPYAYVALAFIVLFSTNVIPLVQSIIQSFQDQDPYTSQHAFVAWANYSGVVADPAFRRAVTNTVLYVIITLVLTSVAGIATAMWLNSLRRGRAFFLAVLVIPWAVPQVVSGATWSLIYNPSNGLLNGLLLRAGLIKSGVIWLQGPWALPLVCLTLIWSTLPLAVILFYAAIEGIPAEYYESARVDGAGSVRAFLSITLPLLRPALAVVLVQALISSASIFDQIFVLNGNADSTISIAQQIYAYAFRGLDFGLGLAAAILVTIATFALSLFTLRVVYREVAYS